MTMKIRTYTDQAREVPDGFTCEGCGALRNNALRQEKSCYGFRRELLLTPDGRPIKAFECVLACRNGLIMEKLGGQDRERTKG